MLRRLRRLRHLFPDLLRLLSLQLRHNSIEMSDLYYYEFSPGQCCSHAVLASDLAPLTVCLVTNETSDPSLMNARSLSECLGMQNVSTGRNTLWGALTSANVCSFNAPALALHTLY